MVAVEAVALAVGIFTLLVLAYLWTQRMPKNFPPGPWGVPIMGNIPFLTKEPHKYAMALKDKYGPILGLRFASYNCVILSDHKLIKQAYALDTIADRPLFAAIAARNGGGVVQGLAFSSGAVWREVRSFIHKQLKRQGFGTRSMESLIWAQVDELVEGLKADSGKPISTHCRFTSAFWNALWALIAGDCFKQTDQRIVDMARVVVEGLAEFDLFTLVAMFLPWWADHGPEFLTHQKAVTRCFGEAVRLFQPYIDEHWASHVPGEPRDFIDAFIDEIKQCEDPGSQFYGDTGRINLTISMLDLFVAGTETTDATFKYTCLFLAKDAAAQQKLYDEVMRVVGSDRHPTLADRTNMPYTEAVMYEVMRIRTLAPIGVVHLTSADIKFCGYDIPKGTMFYSNVYEAHNNKEYWGDPEVFRPERWLSADGKSCLRHEPWLAVSTGKRVCLGAQLSKDELFLVTAGVIQSLSIGLVPGQPPPNDEPKLGGTTAGPHPHELVFTLRE